MNGISRSTVVRYPDGVTTLSSRVLLAKPYLGNDGALLIITEETPFHPVDNHWADQPADTGTLTVHDTVFLVKDVLTAALELSTGNLSINKDIPIRPGEPGWVFLVAHVVDNTSKDDPSELVGKTALLVVDERRRRLLSAAHSASHLVALALNKCASTLWTKAPPQDSLGNPDLDKLAIQSARISAKESTDHYRFGKSLRKMGFDANKFLEQASKIETCINERINSWLSAGGTIWVDAPGSTVEARRFWKCKMADGEAAIPCGGTHLSAFTEFQSITVRFELVAGEPEVIFHTVPILAVGAFPQQSG